VRNRTERNVTSRVDVSVRLEVVFLLALPHVSNSSRVGAKRKDRRTLMCSKLVVSLNAGWFQ
jgi:hypothetical protein